MGIPSIMNMVHVLEEVGQAKELIYIPLMWCGVCQNTGREHWLLVFCHFSEHAISVETSDLLSVLINSRI